MKNWHTFVCALLVEEAVVKRRENLLFKPGMLTESVTMMKTKHVWQQQQFYSIYRAGLRGGIFFICIVTKYAVILTFSVPEQEQKSV